MEEIVKLIAQKTGISEAHARTAVETVVGYLKTKLPTTLAAQLDGVIAGGGANLGDIASSLGGGLGGMFGKK